MIVGLPFDKFPHRLTIEVSAAELVEPMEATYELSIVSGLLRMELISRPE